MPTFPPGIHLKGGQNAAPVLAELAREFYAPIIPVVMELHRQGMSLRAIARELESRGIKPRYGYQAGWAAAQVRRVLTRGLTTAESPACSACETDDPASQKTPSAAPGIHLLIDQVDTGPFTSSQVAAMLDAGEITTETFFRRDRSAEWQRLHTNVVEEVGQ